MRIDKFLSELNIASRSEAKKLIKQKRILVNGKAVTDAGFVIDESKDCVELDGKPLTYERFVYFMLNKPAGVVSATNDNIDKTVIDILSPEGRNDLFPVGRLDKDTVGLLIITNDGDLGHRLTSPKHHADKTYLVKLRDDIDEPSIKKLETGVELNGDGMTRPAKVKVIDLKTIELSITEGKFHQVKRMLIAVGNEVVYLKRLSMGGLILDENLSEGQYRRLTEAELNTLKEDK